MLETTNNNGFIITTEDYQSMADAVNLLVYFCHGSSKAAGWHNKPVENGTRFMLMVSEIAEAMEGDRKNMMDDHLPHRKMVPCELSDASIRIFDFAGIDPNMDLGTVFAEKLWYNQSRLDHVQEVRDAIGGKKY